MKSVLKQLIHFAFIGLGTFAVPFLTLFDGYLLGLDTTTVGLVTDLTGLAGTVSILLVAIVYIIIFSFAIGHVNAFLDRVIGGR